MSKKAVILDKKTQQFYCTSSTAVDGNTHDDEDRPYWSEKSEEAEVFDTEEQAQRVIDREKLADDAEREVVVGSLEEGEEFTVARSMGEVEGVEEEGKSDEDLDEGGE